MLSDKAFAFFEESAPESFLVIRLALFLSQDSSFTIQLLPAVTEGVLEQSSGVPWHGDPDFFHVDPELPMSCAPGAGNSTAGAMDFESV